MRTALRSVPPGHLINLHNPLPLSLSRRCKGLDVKKCRFHVNGLLDDQLGKMKTAAACTIILVVRLTHDLDNNASRSAWGARITGCVGIARRVGECRRDDRRPPC